MVDNSSASQKPMQQQLTPNAIESENPSMISPSNICVSPSFDIPQIPFTPSHQQQAQQQQQITSSPVSVDYQKRSQQQPHEILQHQSKLISDYHMQQQGLQRTPSMSRLNEQQGGFYGGQMNCSQQQQQQNQQPIGGPADMLRSASMGHTGHLPLSSGQAAAAAAQFNLHSQLSASPTLKSGLPQGSSQFNPGNSPGQTLQGMQAMGMMNHMNMSSQMRTNGSLAFSQPQRLTLQQMRQQLLQQASLTANPKLAQSLQRQSYMNAPLSGLAQNGQPSMLHNSFSPQQWLKQMPAISASSSPLYRLQQQRPQQSLLQHQLASSSPHIQLNSVALNPRLSQLAQQQQQLPTLPQQLQLSDQPPQSSARMTAPAGQKSVSLTGSHPDATASGSSTPRGSPSLGTEAKSSSLGTESSNKLLGKRKIQDLVSQVTTFACSLAKHRNSSTLESKDVLLHLEKNWNLTVPGYSSEERKNQQNPIRALMEPSQCEAPINTSKEEAARQLLISPGGANHMMRPPSSDQLVSQSNASQMVQQMNRV